MNLPIAVSVNDALLNKEKITQNLQQSNAFNVSKKSNFALDRSYSHPAAMLLSHHEDH